MKNIFLRTPIFFIFFSLTFIVSPSLQAEAPSSPLRVGFILPLSGGVAGMGEAVLKGIQLFQEDHPGAKKSVEFVIEDHQYDGKKAVSAFHKLREHDHVDIIVVWGVTPSSALVSLAESHKFPLVALTFNPDAKGRSYVMTAGGKMDHVVRIVVDQFKKWQSAKPAAVSIDIGSALAGVEMVNKGLNGAMMVKTISNDEKDFKTLISTFKSRGVDSVLLFVMPEAAMTFIRQCVELHYAPRIVGGDIFADAKFRKGVVGKLPEVGYVYGSVTESFLKRMQAKWGDTSYFYETATGFSWAEMMRRASLQTPRPSNLLDLFRQIDLSDLPVEDMRIGSDPAYGFHFENGAKIYWANE